MPNLKDNPEVRALPVSANGCHIYLLTNKYDSILLNLKKYVKRNLYKNGRSTIFENTCYV